MKNLKKLLCLSLVCLLLFSCFGNISCIAKKGKDFKYKGHTFTTLSKIEKETTSSPKWYTKFKHYSITKTYRKCKCHKKTHVASEKKEYADHRAVKVEKNKKAICKCKATSTTRIKGTKNQWQNWKKK